MSTTAADVDMSRADRVAVWIILAVGFFGGGFVAALGLITGIFRILDPARYPIALLADLLVEGGAGIEQARADTVIVNATGMSSGTLWTLAIADVIGAVAVGCVAASFAYVLFRVARRQPFHRSMQAAALIAGAATAVGGVAFQGLRGLGQMMAADELNDALGGVLVVGFEFEPLVPFVGFGILALAYVFRVGTRLQRETEGLV